MSGDVTATKPSDVKVGLNRIIVKTVHYGPQPMIMEKGIAVAMRDGVELFLNVFRPDRPGRFPVVISADIFGKDGDNVSSLPGTAVFVSSEFTAWESPDPGFWVPNGYALVKAGLRGSSNSKSRLDPMSATETQDFCELIEWAGTQPWSNGNVGTNGVSYLAMTQWNVGPLNPPHLKAMIPWEGVSDVYREWSHHGGIPEIAFSRNYFSRWLFGHKAQALPPEVDDITAAERTHPLWDAFWGERVPKLENIRVPIYVCASWSTQGTHSRGTLEGFKQASSHHKWLEIHGRKEWEYYFGRESLERQKRFFDYFLKGEENDWLDTPRVRLEVRERFYESEVRFENEWPLARTRHTELYLDGRAMSLSPEPCGEASTVVYSTETAGEPRAAHFTHRFDRDTELTGHFKLKLWVSTEDADDMDLFVGIKKYDRRGKEVCFPGFNHMETGHVSSGWLRVSHRELDPERSRPEQPWLKHERRLLLKTGEIVPVEIEILASSTLFRAGERLVLVVQGSDILDTGRLGYGHLSINRGRHRLHVGGRYPSHLLIPVIPRE